MKPAIFLFIVVLYTGCALKPGSNNGSSNASNYSPSITSSMIKSMVLDAWSIDRISNLSVVNMLVGKARACGANTICIAYNIPFDTNGNYLATAPIYGSDISMQPELLIPVISLIRQMGLYVMIKPMTSIYNPLAPGGPTSQGNIGAWLLPSYPTFNIYSFFNGYSNELIAFAQMAQANGVYIFSVGTEADGLTGGAYDSTWRGIISGVRSKFSGMLTFGASVRLYEPPGNINDFRTVGFWDALDYIGLSFYPAWPGLPGKFSDYDAKYLYSNVLYINSVLTDYNMYSLLSPLVQQYGKKIFFEEFVYDAESNILQAGAWDGNLFNYTPSQLSNIGCDYKNQADAYDKFFQYFTVRFAGLIAGYDPWVLIANDIIYNDEWDYQRYRLDQFLIIKDPSGNVIIKPALQVISNYYHGM